jgi:hypothetical protein
MVSAKIWTAYQSPSSQREPRARAVQRTSGEDSRLNDGASGLASAGAGLSGIRNLPKTLWIVIVLVLPDVGSIAWLIAGRPQSVARPGWPAV